MTPACVLRSGGDFSPPHVQWLARQVSGLVCLSDVDVPGVRTIKLEHDWPGWWAKMEMFGPSLQGDVLMIDLDTVVMSIPEMPSQTTVLRDFSEPSVMGSGFMFVTAQDRARVWEAWLTDPERHMRENARWPKWGDQGFLQDLIGDSLKWQDIAPVYSYKAHCRSGLPADAKVVCFHGKPRPWDANDLWIPPLRSDFRDLILKHAGQRIAVMGGGPSLRAHMDEIEADVVLSCNGHGTDIVRPDYVVSMDEVHTSLHRPMGELIRDRTDAPIVSPRAYADIRLPTWLDYPKTSVLTGMVATWLAWVMGARVVILAGMDAYGGLPAAMEHAQAAQRDVKCPIRVVGGGPLTRYFPRYTKGELFMDYEPHPAIETLRGVDGLTRIRALKPCTVGRQDLSRGEEATVMRHDILRLLRHRMVEELPMPDGSKPAAHVLSQGAEAEQVADQQPKRRGRPPKA